MAYQLANYTTDSGISLTTAYLRISSVQLQHETKYALVECSIFSSQDAASASKAAIANPRFEFREDLYSENFSVAPGASPLTQASTVEDISQTQAYLALKNHPSLTTLLTGATAV